MAYRFGKTHSRNSPSRRPSGWRLWVPRVAKLSFVLALLGGIFLTLFLRPHYKRAQTFDLSEISQLEAASLLLDRHGNRMGEDFRVQNRLPVTIDQVPKELVRALIAVEDSRFFEHQGVDWIGIGRALLFNFKAGRRTQGASTITQQLARQSYDLLEESYGRKLTEAFLAHRIEKHFSKEQILEHYLNRIFFGHSFYGVNAAAKGYFGKHVSDVTLDEAAMLCGLIKAPNIYSPLRDREKANAARDHVLNRMVIEDFLTPEQAEAVKKRPIVTTSLTSISRSSHAFHYMREEITDKLGVKLAAQGGFVVDTTLDPALQKHAERSLRRHLNATEAREDYGQQYDLKLMPVTTTSDLPVEGKSQVIVALVGAELHIRIFDATGEKVVDKAEAELKRGLELRDLKNQIRGLANASDLSRERAREIIGSATSIAGHTFGHQTYDQYTKLAREAMSRGEKTPIPEYLQGALLAVDNNNGGIVAMVGGRDYQHFQFNCATQARRPAGSAFKPFVYALAFQNAMFPGSIVTDKVIDNKFVQIGGSDGLLGEWAVETPEHAYLGDITARKGLVLSKNAATVRLGLRVGLEAFLEFVKEAGISSPMRPYNSSFLGSSEVSLAELCKAYTLFPNGGLRPKDLYIIERIRDRDGNVLYASDAPNADLVDVLNETAAYQTHSCLQEVLTEGTASNSSQLGLQSFPAIGGKTGTAYDFTDTWFVGYDSAITCGVWTGFINPKTIYPGAFSNEIALPIWVDFMNASTRTFKPEPIPSPTEGKVIEICTVSGQLATEFCYEPIPGEMTTVDERTTVSEFIPLDFHLTGACTVHAPQSAAEVLRLETESIMHNDASALYGRDGSEPEPVLLRESTVLGLDPYNAVHPPTRAMVPEGEKKPDGEKVVTRATVVNEQPVTNPKVHVRLEAPDPIDIID